MTKKELKVGNWVYRINNFTGLPLEIIYVVSELKDWALKYNEIDFSEVEESEIPYSDLVPVRLTEDILKKLGFVDFKRRTSVEDYAGFKLYSYSEMQFAFNGEVVYQFILEIKKPGSYTGVTVYGDMFRFAHEIQNFLNSIQ